MCLLNLSTQSMPLYIKFQNISCCCPISCLVFPVTSATHYLLLFSPANKFSQAIELYSQAIEANSSNAVYWANRAFAHTKLEEYGSAVQDATKAIEIDSRYSKVSVDANRLLTCFFCFCI